MKQGKPVASGLYVAIAAVICSGAVCGAASSTNYAIQRDFFGGGGVVARSASYATTAEVGKSAVFGNASSAGFDTVAMLSNTPPAADAAGPTLAIATLANGAVTNSQTVIISGGVSDPGGISRLTCNGVARDVDVDGSFAFTLSLSPGANTVVTVATDSAGHKSTDSRVITLDQSAPVVTAFRVTSPSKPTVAVTSFTASDNTRVTGYWITESNVPPAAAATGWQTTPLISYTPTASGDQTLYAWARDAAGNVSLAKSAAVFVDSAAPQITAFSAPAFTKSLAIPVTSLTASDNRSVTGYAITLSGTAPAANAAGWSASAPASFAVTSAGSKTLHAWAKDAAGNVSQCASVTVNVDLGAPVVTAFTLPAMVNTLTVPVSTFSASDNTGVTGYQLTSSSTAPLAAAGGWSSTPPTGISFATSGTKTVYAWAKDAAGNVSPAKSARVNIDTTAPVVSAFAVTTPVNQLTVPVTAFTASDSSGVNGYLITESTDAPDATGGGWIPTRPTSYTASGSGDKTLYAWARDRAGNVSISRSAAVSIDRDPPEISSFSVPALTNKLTIPITSFSASDKSRIAGYMVTTSSTQPAANHAAWSASAPGSFTVTSSGTKTLYGWAKDAAGNVSKAAVATVNVDTTAPAVTAFTLANPAGMLTVPVTSFTAADNTGISGYLVSTVSTPPAATASWSASVPASVTFPSTGSKTAYGWVRDTAGNVSLAKAATTLIPSSVVTTISGKVVNAAGTAQPNVKVSLFAASGALLKSATTTTAGTYSFAGVESGSYKVLFDGAAVKVARKFYNGDIFGLDEASVIPVSSPTVASGINAVLSATGSISGQVTNPDGIGVPGIRVQAYQGAGVAVWGAATSTDASGRYTITGLPTGSYKMQFDGGAAWPVGFYGGAADLDNANLVTVAAPMVTAAINATLASDTTGAIAGTVSNGSDVGVGNVQVRVVTGDTGSFVKSAVTDAAGSFSVAGLRSGSYKVFFNAAAQGFARKFYGGDYALGSGAAVVVGTSTVTGIDGYLAPGGTISGKVTDQNGQGVAGIFIHPFDSGGTEVFGAARSTDANGLYTINGLPSGGYQLQYLYADGRSAAAAVPVTVVDGAAAANVSQVIQR